MKRTRQTVEGQFAELRCTLTRRLIRLFLKLRIDVVAAQPEQHRSVHVVLLRYKRGLCRHSPIEKQLEVHALLTLRDIEFPYETAAILRVDAARFISLGTKITERHPAALFMIWYRAACSSAWTIGSSCGLHGWRGKFLGGSQAGFGARPSGPLRDFA